MLKLERWSRELQNHMYDSVTHNFDRVSGLHDNDMIPLQMQDGYLKALIQTMLLMIM